MNNRKAPIIVDGANVAHWHGKNNFSCRGLLLCLKYFQNRSHQIFIILPQHWERKNELADGHVLAHLHQSGLVSYVPVGNSDDDFIIHFAQIKNAIILTNDRFIKETNLRQDWKVFIQNRVLTYTFVEDDFVPNPNPLNNGTVLDKFLTGQHLAKTSNESPDAKSKTTDDLLAEVLNNKTKKSTDALLAEVLNNKSKKSTDDLLSEVLSSKLSVGKETGGGKKGGRGGNNAGSNKNQQQPNRPNTGRQNSADSAASGRGRYTSSKPAPVNKRPSNDGAGPRNRSQQQTVRGDMPQAVRQHSNPPSAYRGFEGNKPGGGQMGPIHSLSPSDFIANVNEFLFGGPMFGRFNDNNAKQQVVVPPIADGGFRRDNQQRGSKGEQCGDAISSGFKPKPRYVYGMAVVDEVRANYGKLSLPNMKNPLVFYASAYGTECPDLTKVFPKGKTVAVGYSPLPPNADPAEAVQALVVCPADELVHGYGRLAADVKFHGVMISPVYATFGRQVYCPANTYNDKSLPFKDLPSNSWLDFYAMPQYPLEANRPYVAANTVLIRTEGVVVRTTLIPQQVVVWSRLAGHVVVNRADSPTLSTDVFRPGIWFDFRLITAKSIDGCLWCGVDAKVVMPKITTNLDFDDSVVISHNAHAGFLSNGGGLYCKLIGRIGLTDECRNECRSLNLQPMRKVAFSAKYSQKSRLTLGEVVWSAFDVKPSKFKDNNKTNKTLMLKDAQATVDRIFVNNGRVTSASLKTDFGSTVYAEPSDCGPTFDTWKSGVRVKGSIVAQELPLETWGAFCIDKI